MSKIKLLSILAIFILSLTQFSIAGNSKIPKKIGNKNSAILNGVVLDNNDKIMADATIKISGNPEYDTVTNKFGIFKIEKLPAGVYTLECEKKGYNPETISKIKVSAGKYITKTFKLTKISYLKKKNKKKIKDKNNLAKISGFVKDEMDNPIAGVDVKILDTTFKTITDEKGYYIFEKLKPNKYKLKFQIEGYKSLTSKEIKINKKNNMIKKSYILKVIKKKVKPNLSKDDLKKKAQKDKKEYEERKKKRIASKANKSEEGGVKKDKDGELHFKGGRTGEVSYSIDGITVDKKKGKESKTLATSSTMSEEEDDTIGFYSGLEEKSKRESETRKERVSTKPILTIKKSSLKAASHNDNEEFPYFLEFLKKNKNRRDIFKRNFEERYILRFVDGENKPLMGLKYQIIDDSTDRVVWEGKSLANGESIFFPKIFSSSNVKKKDKLLPKIYSSSDKSRREKERKKYAQTIKSYTLKLRNPDVKISLNSEKIENDFFYYPLSRTYQNINTIQLNNLRENFSTKDKKLELDLTFILDTTGSMKDEIKKLKDTIYSIYMRILRLPAKPKVRFALVLYRDKGDAYVTEKYDFTDDIDLFQSRIDNVTAGGGGDFPEDLQSALKVAVEELSYKKEAIKLSFIVADAPAHTDYKQKYDYITAAKNAHARGIKFYTVGASGLNETGEYIFRQISALTYSEFIFLTYGETGESSGAGSAADKGKVSHHTGTNYKSRNLDNLVVDIVAKELSYQIDKELIEFEEIKPSDEKDHLFIRMDNIWKQIYQQLNLAENNKPSVILLPLKTEEKQLEEASEYIRNLSIENIVRSKQFKLIEREKLDSIIEELALSQTGLIDDSNLKEVGRLLSGDMIFTGKLHFLGLERVVYLRAIDIESGEILAAARIRI